MKLAATALLLSSVASSAFAAKAKADITKAATIKGATAKKLLGKSRRLDEEEQQQDEMDFLMNYKMKFVMCAADQAFSGDGEYEYSSVIYRLCPSEVENEKESQFGCTDEEAFGDYIVGINTFVGAYAEYLERMYNGRKLDQQFELNEYAECREGDFEQDEGRKLEQQVELFIGPMCTEEGDDIKLELFTNEACTQVSTTYTYEGLTGRSLPYSEGGLGTEGFFECGTYDDGNYEVSEFCEGTYEFAGKCDQMYSSYCSQIEELEAELKASEAPSKVGRVILILFLIAIVLGAGFWFWQKRKAAKAAAGEGGESGSGPFNQLC